MLQNLPAGRSAVQMPQSVDELKRLYGMTEEDIQKALVIGDGVSGSAVPMVGESLDPVVHYVVLNSAAFAPTLRRWKTYQARAHLEQANLVTSLGRGRWGGSATSEGDLGSFDSSKFERITEQQRQFGQVGVVTRTAQRATQAKFGDLKKREGFNRLTKLLLDGEQSIWFGDPATNPYMFRGMIYQIKQIANNQNLVSLVSKGSSGTSRETYVGGGSLDAELIRAYTERSLKTGGLHTACFLSPADKINISNDHNPNKLWHNLGKGESRVEAGITVDQIDNPLGGAIDMVWSVWFKNGGRIEPYIERDPTDSELFHDEAPERMAAPGTLVVSSGGKLPESITFYYAVAAINNKDEGPAGIRTAGGATTDANGTITIPVTHGADVAKVHAYALYRSTTAPANGDDFSNFRFVKEIAVAGSAVPGGTQNLVDDGTVIPGSRVACLVDESAQSLPELLKPSIRDLADVDNTHRFSLDWEFSPLAHDKCLREVLFEGIGGSVSDA